MSKTDQMRKAFYETPRLVKLASLQNVTANWQCSLGGGGDDDDYGHHHHGGWDD